MCTFQFFYFKLYGDDDEDDDEGEVEDDDDEEKEEDELHSYGQDTIAIPYSPSRWQDKMLNMGLVEVNKTFIYFMFLNEAKK